MSAPLPPPKTGCRWCDCTKCTAKTVSGRPREISRSQWYRHAPWRTQVGSYAEFAAAEQAALPPSLAGGPSQTSAERSFSSPLGSPSQAASRRMLSPDLHQAASPDVEFVKRELSPSPSSHRASLPPSSPVIAHEDFDFPPSSRAPSPAAFQHDNMKLEDEEQVPAGGVNVVGEDIDVKREEEEELAVPLFFDNVQDEADDVVDNDDNMDDFALQAGAHEVIPEPADVPGDLEEPVVAAMLDELQLVQQFIACIEAASLDNDNLPPSVIQSLREPPQDPLTIEDNGMHTGIDLFMSMENETDTAFEKARGVFNRALGRKDCEDEEIPSLFKVKEEVLRMTGIHPMMHDMCPNTCMAYTGPLSEKTECTKCGTPRYDPAAKEKKPQRQFLTLPLGPQLQALWRSEEGAKDMRYRRDLTRELLAAAQLREDKNINIDTYEDIFHGSAYLERVQNGDIKEDDMVLMLSIDGAQLYESKQSDCWIYIWVIMDLAPDKRYKKRHIFPGGFFPGPNKPGNMESFLFPGLAHLSALMKEGLPIWDACEQRLFLSYLFLILGLADGPGLTYLNGLTGHSGAYGCRMFCPTRGRRKEGGNHYYPALSKPKGNYTVRHCDHKTVAPETILAVGDPAEYRYSLNFLLSSKTPAEYQQNRRMTGISRSSILSSLPPSRTLPTPHNSGADLMHLAALNITDCMLSLWRGTMECDPKDKRETWEWAVLVGDIWKMHGQRVGNSRPYLPGSFDRPPRNPAEKISSGYKAWEFLTYFYALGPGLFYSVLPHGYWVHYCKLVVGLRILHQRRITYSQLMRAYDLLLDFVKDYEKSYYQQMASRLHFCRQSIHALLHLALEVVRLGPAVIYTQWPMERTIGNLAEEMFQHSHFYANLSQRGLRRAQINAIRTMMPAEFPQISDAADNKRPRTAISEHGYTLSMAEDHAQPISALEVDALQRFIALYDPTTVLAGSVKIRRWARLLLPNLQIVRTAWKEVTKGFRNCRMARNIMFTDTDERDANQKFAEVQYFFEISLLNKMHTVAMVSRYAPPDATLLSESSGALMVCRYQGKASLEVIPISNIISCIAMVPFSDPPDGRFFVCEKMGLDMAYLGGIQEIDEPDDEVQ